MAWYWYIYHMIALYCIWGYARAYIRGIIDGYRAAKKEENLNEYQGTKKESDSPDKEEE